MVGIEQLQRLLDHAQRAVARAFLGLGREERLVAARLHYLAYVLLAPARGAAVDGRGVDVVHAQVERAVDDRYGHLEVVGSLKGSLAAKAEIPPFVAVLAGVAGGPRAQRLVFPGRGRRLWVGLRRRGP